MAGLGALIYLCAKSAENTNVMPAGTGKKLIRWLPTMDEVMTSKKEQLSKVFGIGSCLHRLNLQHS